MTRFILACALALAACGGDNGPTAPDAVTFAGSYTLQSINGQGLPYVYAQVGNNSVTIVTHHLTIADGGTWSETLNVRNSQNGVVTTQTIAAAGAWIRSGNQLALIDGSDNQTEYTGTFSTNRLNLDGGGLAFVFTK